VSEAARVDATARATVRARVMRRFCSVWRADVVAPLWAGVRAAYDVAQAAERALATSEARGTVRCTRAVRSLCTSLAIITFYLSACVWHPLHLRRSLVRVSYDVVQAAERALATSEAARIAATARATVRCMRTFLFSGCVRALA
jgi:hypothetical protein